MSILHRLFALGIALCIFVPSHSVKADLGTVKPDLRVQTIGPSPLGAEWVRVVVVNAGWAPSGTCSLRLQVQEIGVFYPDFLYRTVPALPASTSAGSPTALFDFFIGTPMLDCGLSLGGKVDWLNVVTESNESNNTTWFVTPPC